MLVVILLLAVVQDAANAAQPLRPAVTKDQRSAAEALLAQRDGVVRPEQWHKLGPGALTVLEEVANDPNALSTRRARAIEGLVELHSPRAPAILERLARAENTPVLVRSAAIRGASRALPASRQVRALQPALEKASDVRVRALAAEVLSRHVAGCSLVLAQGRRERADDAARFTPAIRRCQER